ncbi:Cation/H(+) antiporter 3 [Bienertia sinuspersici]
MDINTTTTQEVCIKVPPWYPKGRLVEFPSMILQLQMFIVYCLTQAIHHGFFKYFGLPPLVSQLIAGVLLSPEIFGNIKAMKTTHELIFPETSDEVWKCIAMLGFSLSIFIISVKTDFTIVKKTGKKPIIIGILVLIVTSISSTTIALMYGNFADMRDDQTKMRELTASASVLALSTFPVIAILLTDLKLLNSELGRLALSCGIIGEIAGISHTLIAKSVLSTIALLQERKKKEEVMLYVGNRVVCLIAFVFSVIFVLRPWMKRIIKQTPKGKSVKENYLILIFLLMLLGGIITDISGEFVIVGCFVIGAAIPDGPPLGSAIVNKFDTLVSEIFQPFLITMSAMRADVFSINFHDKLILGELIITFAGYTGKFIVCLGCGLYYNMGISDSLALAAIMSSKGIVDIGLYNMFIDSQLIGESTYAYLILVTIVVAIVIPITIKFLYHPPKKYAGYQNRDIVSCNPEAHLRILSCISKPDHVPAIVHLLALSNPTSNNMIVDVLHLIKLSGRSHPIFISHDIQTGIASENMSYSEDVISSFTSLVQRASLHDYLFTHFFTTVTQPKAMHDDICTLALDNLASLIILPFHRKLSTLDGSIEFEDNTQRALNISILDRAPCSVGIFINRGTFKPESSNLTSVVVQSQSQLCEQNEFSVAVILIGGADDHEAVAYAKRMASGPKIWVLVIRVIAFEDNTELSESDSIALTDIQQYANVNQQFNYSEQMVRDGSQTAKMLRSIAEDFDLIVVGRRHDLDCCQTSGLQEWSEVRELGILGDILASPDFPGKTSILVVQRQQQWTPRGYKYN